MDEQITWYEIKKRNNIRTQQFSVGNFHIL